MIPTFWIENKIKDASNDVKKDVLVETQDVMQKLSQAQMLIFEADKTSFDDLFRAENLVKEAVEIWPAFKQREFRKLGLRMAHTVIHDGLLGEADIMWVYDKNDRSWLARSAINYLTETVLNASAPEAEDLLELACMYGYQQQFEQMMQIIGRAVKIDEAIKEEFRERKVLIMLLRACHSDRNNIEKLEKKIDIPPVSKDSFCNFIKNFDITDYHGDIQWLAVKRPSLVGEGGIFVLKIRHPLPSNKGLVNSFVQSVETGKTDPIVPNAKSEPIEVEELYDILFPAYFLICYSEPTV